MTLKEALKKVDAKINGARITAEEAEMAYRSDRGVARTADRIIRPLPGKPGFMLIALAAMMEGVPPEEYAEMIKCAAVETALDHCLDGDDNWLSDGGR